MDWLLGARLRRPVGDIEIGIEAPGTGLPRHLDEEIEQCLELVALHGPEAEAREMRRHPFAVAQMIAPGGKLPVERDERDLRGMLDRRELRLAEEHLADGEPIEAADEASLFVPHLDRVGVARFMRVVISV